jgi:N-methylhydantoinase A
VTGYRIGIDIGGTFTDFCLFDQQNSVARVHKRLTTSDDPSEGVLGGIAALLEEADVAIANVGSITHGTTLVTNAVIERRGAPTAMLVTEGFADVLNIGYERRYDLFDLTIRFPEPVVPRFLRFEVPGRLRSDGTELAPLDLSGLENAIADAIERHKIQAIAVCFLHAYANPAHEKQAVAWLGKRFPALAVSSSADVFPFMREYERWTTTCVNACVQPVVDRYLNLIERGLKGLGFMGKFLVMNSSGGTLTSAMARRFPVRLLESGPAAGALMSASHGSWLGLPSLLSFDMGGTTAKGCIIQASAPLKRYDLEVARVHEFKKGSGLPIKIPVLDMIEIGSGGGSLAVIDDRGVISVGPSSAGAKPGPAAYGLGGVGATLTDANLVLGYLGTDSFLGGSMRLDKAAAVKAIERQVASPLGVDVVAAAWGMHEVINEDVARAFRVHASERGVDYRRCSMIVFGGSGPLHGASVAKKLRVPRVICPVGAGVMSAFGLLSSPNAFEIVRSRRTPLRNLDPRRFAAILLSLREEIAGLLTESTEEPIVSFRFQLDMRYEGQGYEIEVPVEETDGDDALARVTEAFGRHYQQVFGVSFPDRAIEIVSWKVEAKGPTPGLGEHFRLHDAQSLAPSVRSRDIWVPSLGKLASCPVYSRYALKAGDAVAGPALVEERESTCVLHDGDHLTVDERLNLVIEIGNL